MNWVLSATVHVVQDSRYRQAKLTSRDLDYSGYYSPDHDEDYYDDWENTHSPGDSGYDDEE